jgi:hypothetical protein
MTSQHPITPPTELVQEWTSKWNAIPLFADAVSLPTYIANRAAQWGADQELEACRAFLLTRHGKDYGLLADALRAARRPKQPSLKGQALLQLDTLNADLAMHGRGCDLSQIRRALEQLND